MQSAVDVKMKSVAVIYATREGHTRKIAEHVARDFCSHGFGLALNCPRIAR
jgi:menaquinone-dependent protoporphyrinogen IX oxidase